jgi:hypothetical protein
MPPLGAAPRDWATADHVGAPIALLVLAVVLLWLGYELGLAYVIHTLGSGSGPS